MSTNPECFSTRAGPERLKAAFQWLERGEPLTARQLAQDALSEAELGQNRSLEVQALMCLAYADRACGRYRRAHETALRAARLHRLLGGLAGEVEALTLLARCAVNLGRDDEAVEAALLSSKLGEGLPSGPHQVASLCGLGVAYLWSRSFSLADAALTDAVALARKLGPGYAWHPMTSLAWVEVVRLAKARFFAGVMPQTDELTRRAQACHQAVSDEVPVSLMPGTAKTHVPMARMTQALAWCWSGHPDKALAELRKPSENGADNGARVVDVAERWVFAEISWLQGDFVSAEKHGRRVLELADQVEHEQLACLAHLMLAQLLEQQGKCDAALQEMRSLRQREMRIDAERVESRHWAVKSALDMRSSEQTLAQLARYSKELERLSFEDHLTSLPNRRRFEAQLESLLAAGLALAPPVCVALIDLDDFKRVNDNYTHEAGDEALKGVANALRGCVRELDLPARLAGDEFVVLFPRTALAEAERVCERITEAVARLRWPHLHPDLQVSVTIGVAQAQDGDTPASLLHRSDVAMFARK